MCYRRILMMTETAEKRLDIPLAPYIQEWYNKTIEVSVNRNAQNGRHCNGVDRFAYKYMSCSSNIFLILVPNRIIMYISNMIRGDVVMVDRNIIIAKAGGTAGKASVNYKISLPADMVKELGVTQEDRKVTVSMINGKIIIEKKIEEH